MPVAVACPKCKKKYNLPDKYMGKTIKCPDCQTQFQIPTAGGQRQVDPRLAARRQQAIAAQRKRAAELQSMGVDGPIQRTPDVFDGLAPMQGTADPLNNMMLEDPGFADVRSPTYVDTDIPDNPNADMFSNPAIQQEEKKTKPKAKKKKKKKKRGDVAWYSQPWFFLIAFFIPLFMINAAMLYFEVLAPKTGEIITLINVGLFLLINAGIGWWGLGLVAQEGSALEMVLCRFVPGYLLFFIIGHWNSMKDYAYAAIAGVMLTPLALVLLFMGKMWVLGDDIEEF